MAGSYAYTPDIWPPLVVALCVAALGWYSWRRDRVPGARPFAITCLFWTLWLLSLAGQAAATDLSSLVAAYRFEGLWRLPATTAIFCFTLEYVRPGRWLTRRNLIILTIPSVIIATLILTDGRFHLIWRRLVVDGMLRPEPALLGWVFLVYGLVLALLQIVALSWLFVRSPQHRWPAGLMLAMLIVARVLFLRDLMQPGASDAIDNVFLALLLPALTYAIALFGFHIFDPLPTARETVFQQMRAGVVVFDTDWRTVSLNPAAEAMLGVRSGAARGKPWHALLPSGQFPATDPDAVAGPGVETAELPEMTVGAGAAARVYAPALSPLKDVRGPLIGRLLILRDVTAERRAQTQILEQQRTLAVLEERERLARELHDGLGQALAAAHLQASAARLLLDQGETERVDEQLATLCETTLQAQIDVREYLMGSQSAVSADHPFFPTLEQYLRRFTRQYGLPVELVVSPELAERGLPNLTEVQLMRIIQEALSNVRKHAGARCVQVIFSLAGAQAQVDIVDDGRGFDPAATAASGEGYGLQSMRERAHAVNGSLQVIARPGAGTRVVVQVPLKAGSNEYAI